MSDIPLTANGVATGERPSGADERRSGHRPARHGSELFSRIALFVIVIFWTAQFTFETLARHLLSPNAGFPRLYARGATTICAILLSFVVLALLRAARRESLVRRAVVASGLAVAGCAIHSAVNILSYRLFFGPPISDDPNIVPIMWLARMSDYIWYYAALSVTLLALTYSEDLVENRDRIASLEAQANAAQLNALRYQLNPHFLFNTLNSVASLISKKMGADAETMVVSLSDFLRTTLSLDSGREITLGEEIKLQGLYLDIEKIRFPERLRVTIDVPEDLRDACVPNLITQPLIENVIKYGVARSTAPVHLEVIARSEEGRLSLEIRDDGGNARDGAPAGTQLGLRNVAERLKLHFGAEGSLVAGRRPEGGFSARILIPLRRAE